nr:hypothetical protein [Veronia nyctiphanis]
MFRKWFLVTAVEAVTVYLSHPLESAVFIVLLAMKNAQAAK